MSSSEDPHQAREASRYENPVASREFIAKALTDAREPVTVEALAEQLNYPPDSDQFEGLRRRVGAMQRDGQLVINRKGGLMAVDEASLLAGRIQAHPDGFGFLIADDGGEDVYLNGKQMRVVLHGDRVVVAITGLDRRGRREGRIIEVVERAHTTLVGRFVEEHGLMTVVPDNKRIHLDVVISEGHREDAVTGDIVVVELTEQPTRRHPPMGRVIEVLGPELKAGMEIDVALRSHDIPHVWPDAVIQEADTFGAAVRDKDIPGRKDVRNLPLMTIDGADARDFDDAVYAERTEKGFRLLVAIADVAHYVKPGAALDDEAQLRGTSVYFPGQVVPMLPEILSNGLCSLNPDVDRLCMLAELSLNAEGGIKRMRFYNAVMRSHARLTYNQAWEMLSDPDSALRSEHSNVTAPLDTLYEVYKVLRAGREKRGVIEFESSETRIVFDENRKIQEILPVHRNDAHKLIEECMILANIAASTFVDRQQIPALYRVHHGPKSDRLEDLRAFLAHRDLTLTGGDSPSPVDYARLSRAIQGRADQSIIETTMLRSMQQAIYQPKNEGHFGLALTQYAHFTSPIRRYPDLLVHRAIKFALTRADVESYQYSTADMQVMGESCSMTERRADEASRDVLSWLKCEYMQSHVGDEFDGVIATVTSFGLFVELKDFHIEGLVHITSLVKDYYRFDPIVGALIGEKTGREYHLGEPIRVCVAAVNLDDRKIDFQEVDTGPRKRKRVPKSALLDPSVRQQKPKKSKSQKRRDKQRLKAKQKPNKEGRSVASITQEGAPKDNSNVWTAATSKSAKNKDNEKKSTADGKKTASKKPPPNAKKVSKKVSKKASKKAISKKSAAGKKKAHSKKRITAKKKSVRKQDRANAKATAKKVSKRKSSAGKKKVAAKKVSTRKTSAAKKKVAAKKSRAKKTSGKKR